MNWLRVLQITLIYWSSWRKLIYKLGRNTRQRRSFHKERAGTKHCNHAHARPTSRNGVQRISLTTPLEYAVASVHLEPFETLLRSLTLATSSLSVGIV